MNIRVKLKEKFGDFWTFILDVRKRKVGICNMKNKGNLLGAIVLTAALSVSSPFSVLAENVTAAETVELSWEERAEDTYNLLLIGVDRRNTSWNGNSDVMILVTVNPEKESIYMTSFLRDLYADIEGLGVQKLNAACAYGGADLCVQTIEENYQVKIDNYAMVDFNSMIAVVDAFGGVDLELTEHEVKIANQYVNTMCEANGVDYEEHQIIGTGMLHLDGYQAVGFMRNRYSGSGSDFGRTDRQRAVIVALMDKMQDAGVDSLDDLLFDVLPRIEHDMNMLKILDLASKLPDWLGYRFEQQHIPYDGMYYSQNEILMPDMEETLELLHETIY